MKGPADMSDFNESSDAPKELAAALQATAAQNTLTQQQMEALAGSLQETTNFFRATASEAKAVLADLARTEKPGFAQNEDTLKRQNNAHQKDVLALLGEIKSRLSATPEPQHYMRG
jgi:hypothetical protein